MTDRRNSEVWAGWCLAVGLLTVSSVLGSTGVFPFAFLFILLDLAAAPFPPSQGDEHHRPLVQSEHAQLLQPLVSLFLTITRDYCFLTIGIGFHHFTQHYKCKDILILDWFFGWRFIVHNLMFELSIWLDRIKQIKHTCLHLNGSSDLNMSDDSINN